MQLLDRRAQARGLGLARAQIVDAPAHAMHLLGGVDDAKVGAKRAHDFERALDRQLIEPRG